MANPGVSNVAGFLLSGDCSTVIVAIFCSCTGIGNDHVKMEGYGVWCVSFAVVAAFHIELVAVVGADGVDGCHLVLVGVGELSTLCMGG